MKSILFFVFVAICSAALSQNHFNHESGNFRHMDYDLATDADITAYLNQVVAADSELNTYITELDDDEGK
jgi:hypothetical protein